MKILNSNGYNYLFDITKKIGGTKDNNEVNIEKRKTFLHEGLVKENHTLEYHNNIKIDDKTIRQLNHLSSDKQDAEAAIIIHKIFNKIDNYEANDERLWGYLTCVIFKKYVIDRWSFTKNSSGEKFKNRFFYEGNGTTTRAYNAIARLYWAAERTYDKQNSSDPYHLTKMFYLKQDIATLYERNLGGYPTLLKEYLIFIENNKDKIKITSKIAQQLNAGINARGGVQDLSLLSSADIREVIKSVCEFYGYDNLSF